MSERNPLVIVPYREEGRKVLYDHQYVGYVRNLIVQNNELNIHPMLQLDFDFGVISLNMKICTILCRLAEQLQHKYGLHTPVDY